MKEALHRPALLSLSAKIRQSKPLHRPYQRRTRSRKPLFQGNTTTENRLPKLAPEFPPSHCGLLLNWPLPPSPAICRKPNHQPPEPRSTNCPASRTNPCHPSHRAAFAIAVHCISHRNALHKPTQRTAFPEVVRWEQTRSTSSVPQHCTATRHIRTPTAKEASRGLPAMPLPHIKTEGQPHG